MQLLNVHADRFVMIGPASDVWNICTFGYVVDTETQR